MVASLEEAFGTKTLKPKKTKVKSFNHYVGENINDAGRYFDDNTFKISNDLYKDPQYLPYKKFLKRNNLPTNILLGDSEEPVRVEKVPTDMSGTGQLAFPADIQENYHAAAPGSQQEHDFINRRNEEQTRIIQANTYTEEDMEEYEREAFENNYPVEGMIDYQSFEQDIQKSIRDLTEKVNSLLNGKTSIGGSPLSNGMDVLLYIFTGIFFLFMFDLAVKLGKMRR